jgi:hypothetical protein
MSDADAKKYVVKFREPKKTETSDAWWPNGETRECCESDAWIRCGHLFELALKKVPIEGGFIEYVRIQSAQNEEVIFFIADPEDGGIFLGPWAEHCDTIKAFRSKVEAESKAKRMADIAVTDALLGDLNVVDMQVPAFATWAPTHAMMN